jgi:hypothetical protein
MFDLNQTANNALQGQTEVNSQERARQFDKYADPVRLNAEIRKN